MEFEDKAKNMIKAIPRGKVATYAQIAALAGNYRAARQVVRVLHSSSDKDRLPWHRVINSRGGISLRPGRGFEEQKRLLLREGVCVSRLGRIDLDEFQWEPAARRSRARSNAAKKFLGDLTRANTPAEKAAKKKNKKRGNKERDNKGGR
jgi:methylated-DNA-protein-cysteine methyltransferase-like protein